ncbi:PREDICTED: F-box protein At2g32560-like isoform X1 [Nelumbo nucifera]|uniref:F-box protein At2g32560-like isoform X1 n=1 Tax=Nelumbo nucifera TaxID=4432 RepID=A0A1U7ZFA8_NELNU|nr:PREDICTED: F-box protein At2g32560-like isoform X1 [Nelumbo nucifera]
MLFFLISCLSVFLLSKSLSLKPLAPWASEMRLLSLWFWKELFSFHVSWLRKSKLSDGLFEIPARMSLKKSTSLQVENVEETEKMCVLDLPELALECILGRLPPSGLRNMAGVCISLRDRCRSDHLWERHMKEKWGRVIGRAAHREWQWHIASRKDLGVLNRTKQKGFVRSLSSFWPLPWIRSKLDNSNKPRSSLPVDSVMSWYLALESGKFWFPAQVYNREHGHVGFMLSCYDAELSYDSRTDTFQARYPPHGRRTVVIEDGVQWDRLRAPPVDTRPHDLHVSDCLHDLHPGDHIEIQWRRNKEFPYGWWYGVVGHLESCDGNENHCHCYYSDIVILEFNQYAPGSRWRQAAISRKDHREEGNEADGFYGGIRKIYCEEEISTWKRLWPTEVLE